MLELNRGTLVAAAALCAVGSILGLMGLALAAAAIVGAGRRWYRAVGTSGGAWRVAEQEKYSPASRTESMS